MGYTTHFIESVHYFHQLNGTVPVMYPPSNITAGEPPI